MPETEVEDVEKGQAEQDLAPPKDLSALPGAAASAASEDDLYTQALAKHPERFIKTDDGKIAFKSLNPDGTFRPLPANNLDELIQSTGKKTDHANAHIGKLEQENSGLREKLAHLEGRFDEFSQSRNKPDAAAPTIAQDFEPDWKARIQECAIAYEREGDDPDRAARRAYTYVDQIERPKYYLQQENKVLREQVTRTDSKVDDMMSVLRGYVSTNELSSTHPLLSDFKLTNKEVQKLFSENPYSSSDTLAMLWIGKKVMSGRATIPQSGNGGPSPKKYLSDEELLDDMKKQIRGAQKQPLGGDGVTNAGASQHVVTDQDRVLSRSMGLPSDDKSIRARVALAKEMERR